ncbi:MAG TPA: ABC transporter permease subunit, partial [Candidatus Limnocylindrales bacterium]|nr:ABC transporter permease subunit [Candidatus Limnocylindrales bacterium]
LRAVPSLGLLFVAIMVAGPHLGGSNLAVLLPCELVLVILAIPPILVNAYTGIAGVDPEVTEAGRAAGMRGWQVLSRVELPLAVPVILTGIRSGASQVVATATLAAVFGGPGLGRFIVEGYAQLYAPGAGYPEMWAGVILVGAAFAAVEVGLAAVQRALTSPGLRLASSARAA